MPGAASVSSQAVGGANAAHADGTGFGGAHLVHVALVVQLYQISTHAPLSEGLSLFYRGNFLHLPVGGAVIRQSGQAIVPVAWRWIRLIGMNYILLAFGQDFLLPILYPKPGQMNAAHFLPICPLQC